MQLVKEIEFQAQTEQEAYQRARERLGPDGVILSIQTVFSGVPFLPFLKKKKLVVRAGILEEDSRPRQNPDPDLERKQLEVLKVLLEHKTGQKKRAVPEILVEQVLDRVEVSPPAAGTPAVPQTAVSQAQAVSLPGFPQPGSPGGQRFPLPGDLPEACARSLSEEAGRALQEGLSFDAWLRRKVESFCERPGNDPLSSHLGGNRVMILGPTGVGKTTTIAKIAALAVQQNRKIALFTSDNYRVSAVDQIRTFARVLNIPFEAVNGGAEIPSLVERYPEDTLLIMDTVGFGFRETDRLERIREIHAYFRPQATHVAVSATAKPEDVKASIESTRSAVPVHKVILTKIDETCSYGSFLWIPMTFGLPFSFFTTGQNVPRDIQFAAASWVAQTLLDARSAQDVSR
jgi:flagellar biosynthesis protein FlhF